ncbi:MAG: YmfQ family protein [Haemophilus parainfluenzae]|nr:YmfQ family protein [Haemophilus parainfluenzae]
MTLEEELLKNYPFDLSKYVPLFIYNGGIFNRMYKAQEYQLSYLAMQTDDLLKQGFVDTATWGLTAWEEEFGIATNLDYSYEERREVIKAKKRGQGTCTKSLIKNVAEAFSGGECRIIENTAPYTFTIQFVGVKGIPKNMDGLKQAINDIKPAHLVYDFKYTYTSWEYLDSKNLSWENAEALTFEELEIYE